MSTKKHVMALAMAALALTIAGAAGAQEQFSIVLLPDTQHYTEPENTHYNIYARQTKWIADNKNARNIKFVIHLGDITEHDVEAEWIVADAAHDILDSAGIPFSMTPGNHDIYPYGSLHVRESMFSDYFGPQRYLNKPWYGGSFNATNENNYMFFEAAGMQFMVLSLEFTPRKDVVTWANRIISQHPNHRVIVATHCYQDVDGDHAAGWSDRYNIEGREGVDLWEELIQRHKNIFLVASGHITGIAYKKRIGLNGNEVHEILNDFQSEPVGGVGGPALGNGWLRVLKFDPAQDKVYVDALSTENGNKNIFANATGEEELYIIPHNDPHNKMDYDFSYDMQSTPPYQYVTDDLRYKDRRAHTSLRGDHRAPRIVSVDNGNTIVVWQDDRDGNGKYQIYMRAFDADGNAVFSERVVNSIDDGNQRYPVIAADGAGNFVVAWEDDKDNNGVYQIMAGGFNANGSRRFSDRYVNTVIDGQQLRPTIAMDDNGRFAVAWEDDRDGNGSFQILMRGFNSDGSQRFSERTVNSVETGQQLKPAMAMAPNGNFVVTWEDDKDDNGSYQIMAGGFNADGSRRFNDKYINSVSDGQQRRPAIGMDGMSRFVVAWEDDKDDNNSYQIMAGGFNADGSRRFSDRYVNSVSDGQQRKPAIGMNDTGRFVVAWEDDTDNNGSFQIHARSFNADASQRRADFTVNSDDSGQQRLPAVSMDPLGRYTVAWQDDMDGDLEYGILLRNFNF